MPLTDTRFDNDPTYTDTDTIHYFGSYPLLYRVDLSQNKLEYLSCKANNMWKRIDTPRAVVVEIIRLNNLNRESVLLVHE